ncbi:MFS transporter [Kitasatospora sp. NPDC001159]
MSIIESRTSTETAPPGVPSPAAPAGPGHRAANGIVLLLLCLSEFMMSLDFSIVNVSLPVIQDNLGFGAGDLVWVVTAYVLAFGGFLIVGGRLADLYGRRRLLVLGLVGFTGASLLAGLADSPGQLIALRAVQGLCAAAVTPAALATLTTTFTGEKERQQAMGAWGAVLGAGFVSGVVGGGVITQYLNWSWVFWINVPIGTVLAVLAARLLGPGRDGRRPRRMDLPGAVLITCSVVALVFALSESSVTGWTSTRVLGALALAAVGGLAFAAVELRSTEPVLPLGLLKLRRLVVANLANVLMMGSFFGLVYTVTLFLQDVMAFSPLRTGLTFAGAGVAGLAAGAASEPLARKFGATRVLIIGALFQAAATGVLATLPTSGTQPFVSACTVVVNFSGVVAIVMINLAATENVADQDQGAAGGLLSTCEQIGGAIGLAVISTVAASRAHHLAGSGHPDTQALLAGDRWGMATAAALAVAGALTALVGLRKPAKR